MYATINAVAAGINFTIKISSMKENFFENKTEASGERSGDVLAHITFSRHGETRYTDQYPDITDNAIQSAQSKGEVIVAEKGAPEIIVHSPSVRAKGTADAIHTGIRAKDDLPEVRMHQSKQIRPSDIPDREKAREMFESLGNQEEISRQHHVEGGVFTDGELMETPESKRVRLYRALEYLIRSFVGEKSAQKKDAPHIVIVSHYELVSLLVSDIFGDLKETFDRYSVPSFGQHVDVTLIRTDDPNIVTVKVDCDGKTVQRDFDRAKRFFV